MDSQRSFYNAAYPRKTIAGAQLARVLRPFELHRVDAVLRLLPRGGQLLDIGCGNGDLIARSSGWFATAIGLDVADTQLAAAAARFARASIHNTALVQANVDRGLPLRAEQFDVVTIVAVLAFIFDPYRVLAEIHRVLKPGGWLAVEVLNLVYLPRRLAVLSGRLPRHTSCHGWEGGHLHNFTRDALAELLREAGFSVVHTTGSGVFANLRAWWPSLLLGNIIVLCRKSTGP